MKEKRIKVVYPNGFHAEYRQEIASILLSKGAVETEKAYRKRIDTEIAAKKNEQDTDEAVNVEIGGDITVPANEAIPIDIPAGEPEYENERNSD